MTTYLDLVAVGTIADVMRLQGENRVIVTYGLLLLQQTDNPGLRMLMREAGVETRRMTASVVSFTLAPRINAAGRMGCADEAAQLFLTDSPSHAQEIAALLCCQNKERQNAENEILRQAYEVLQKEYDPQEDRMIVLWGENWHHGVIGIVSSRISDRYGCPTVLISLDGDQGKGSGRSVNGFNLFEALEDSSQYLEKFGGHALAAGLTISRDMLPAFKQSICAYAKKNITEEDLLTACTYAFEGGWNNVKLYFMMGLPTETNADFDEMSQLCKNIAYRWRMTTPNRARGVKITASTSCFVPKPQTPFQWDAQATKEELDEKTAYLRQVMKTKNVTFRWHASDTSFLEGAFARGDRRMAEVLYTAWKSGCKMDGWEDCFSLEKWMDAFRTVGLDPAFYANRQRPLDEVFPWDHIGCGTTKEHLKREWERSRRAEPTPSCLEKCAGCGAAGLLKGCACSV